MKIVHIIMNEQHTLMDSQKDALLEKFPAGVYEFNFIDVPAKGWPTSEQNQIMRTLYDSVLFISPIPYMLMELSKESQINSFQCPAPTRSKVEHVYVMVNDNREKKELPNGKIIHTVAKTGWYIA